MLIEIIHCIHLWILKNYLSLCVQTLTFAQDVMIKLFRPVGQMQLVVSVSVEANFFRVPLYWFLNKILFTNLPEWIILAFSVFLLITSPYLLSCFLNISVAGFWPICNTHNLLFAIISCLFPSISKCSCIQFSNRLLNQS